MPDPSPHIAAQRHGYQAPPRIDTLKVLQGEITLGSNQDSQRNYPAAASFLGLSISKETAGYSGSRSRLSTPVSPASDMSRRTDSSAASRRVSSSASSNDSRSTTSTRGVRSMFSKKKERPKAGPYPLDNACFSAAGNTLYLWKPRQTNVMILPIFTEAEVPHTRARKKSCSEAFWVGGGTSKYVVVSLINFPQARIELYPNDRESNQMESVTSVTLDSTKACFAISRDDQRVAMATRRGLSVWNLQTHSDPRVLPFPADFAVSDSDIHSQFTEFSANSKSITVATRVQNGRVFIHAWDLESQADPPSPQSASFNTPFGSTNDFGVSSAFCDNARRVAIVTVNASNVRQIVQNLPAPNPTTPNSPAPTNYVWPTAQLQDLHFSYKISSAAQDATGSKYVMATSDRRVFAFSLERQNVRVRKIADFSSERTQPKDKMAIACPDEETVYTFWFDKDRRKLNMAIIRSRTEPPTVLDLRSCFEY